MQANPIIQLCCYQTYVNEVLKNLSAMMEGVGQQLQRDLARLIDRMVAEDFRPPFLEANLKAYPILINLDHTFFGFLWPMILLHAASNMTALKILRTTVWSDEASLLRMQVESSFLRQRRNQNAELNYTDGDVVIVLRPQQILDAFLCCTLAFNGFWKPRVFFYYSVFALMMIKESRVGIANCRKAFCSMSPSQELPVTGGCLKHAPHLDQLQHLGEATVGSETEEACREFHRAALSAGKV